MLAARSELVEPIERELDRRKLMAPALAEEGVDLIAAGVEAFGDLTNVVVDSFAHGTPLTVIRTEPGLHRSSVAQTRGPLNEPESVR